LAEAQDLEVPVSVPGEGGGVECLRCHFESCWGRCYG
jgi:hypothetical protein